MGLAATLTKNRLGGFWIPKARHSVNNAISDCFMCKKFNALSFIYPKLTNLPKTTVNFVCPLKETGIEYLGHLWVKSENKSRKMYFIIFTCLNIRAIHIKLLPDMAIIRFTKNFGIPSIIYSDITRSLVSVLGTNIVEYHVQS